MGRVEKPIDWTNLKSIGGNINYVEVVMTGDGQFISATRLSKRLAALVGTGEYKPKEMSKRKQLAAQKIIKNYLKSLADADMWDELKRIKAANGIT